MQDFMAYVGNIYVLYLKRLIVKRKSTLQRQVDKVERVLHPL